ncbi:hypothetical protein Pint_20486 [Pistacia integerrima]|uniref:Uncharacterized protein n=1 Tax=Pistacia integerrima TaxID=434235 RepID=A0ACC0X8Y6_9ROSI|nr:hypothetical protein Pint_20486 [Pistacia integerrima]
MIWCCWHCFWDFLVFSSLSECFLEFFDAFWVCFLGGASLVLRLSAVSGGVFICFVKPCGGSLVVVDLFWGGKELWGHIDGSNKVLTDVSKLAQWQTKDAQLLREEQRLTTQATYQHDKMISNAVAYAAQGKGKGHIIKECPTRPQNRQANAYQATMDSAPSATPSASSALTPEKIANGCQLPIHAIGDVDSTIRDVFVSPQLSTRSGVGQDTCERA